MNADTAIEAAKLALQAATVAWPALSSWLRSASDANPYHPVSEAVRNILPPDGESAKAARVLRDG